jgi:hypothetical protein
MLGLLGIGIALTLGAGVRIAAATGARLYLLMWTVVLPPENNPVIDDHLLGGLTLIALGPAQRRRHLGPGPLVVTPGDRATAPVPEVTHRH